MEYKNLLNHENILKSTPNLDDLSVTLKAHEIKGAGLYSTNHLKRGKL